MGVRHSLSIIILALGCSHLCEVTLRVWEVAVIAKPLCVCMGLPPVVTMDRIFPSS